MNLRSLAALALLLAAPTAFAAGPGSTPSWATPSAPAAAPAPSVDPSARAQAPGTPAVPTAVPLDGGLILLAAAGAGLAAKKLRARRA